MSLSSITTVKHKILLKSEIEIQTPRTNQNLSQIFNHETRNQSITVIRYL